MAERLQFNLSAIRSFQLELYRRYFFHFQKPRLGAHSFSTSAFFGGLNQYILKKNIQSSQTAVILGGSPALCELRPHLYSELDKYFTVGINRFCIHQYVPSLSLIEFARPCATQAIYNDVYSNVTLKERFVCVKDFSRFFYHQKSAQSVAESLPHSNLFLPRFFDCTGDISNIIGSDSSSQARDYFNALLHIRSVVPFILQIRASIVSAIDICMQLGFTNILLWGFELNSTQYFWEDSSMSPFLVDSNYTSIQSGQARHAPHSTVIPSNRRPSIIDVLRILQHSYFTPHDVDVSVIAPSYSPLQEFLSAHNSFHDFLDSAL